MCKREAWDGSVNRGRDLGYSEVLRILKALLFQMEFSDSITLCSKLIFSSHLRLMNPAEHTRFFSLSLQTKRCTYYWEWEASYQFLYESVFHRQETSAGSYFQCVYLDH